MDEATKALDRLDRAIRAAEAHAARAQAMIAEWRERQARLDEELYGRVTIVTSEEAEAS